MSLHEEIKFEDEICEHLSTSGWLYGEKDAADYDRQLALFPSGNVERIHMIVIKTNSLLNGIVQLLESGRRINGDIRRPFIFTSQ